MRKKKSNYILTQILLIQLNLRFLSVSSNTLVVKFTSNNVKVYDYYYTYTS